MPFLCLLMEKQHLRDFVSILQALSLAFWTVLFHQLSLCDSLVLFGISLSFVLPVNFRNSLLLSALR